MGLVPNELKKLESLGNLGMQYNNGNLHPVLAYYTKDMFIGLGFLN